MLSVAASHASDVVRAVLPVERRFGGADGASPSVVGPGGLSTSGPPLAVVAAALILFGPAASVAFTVAVCQVVHAPVPAKASPAETAVPLTERSIGRFTVVPLA